MSIKNFAIMAAFLSLTCGYMVSASLGSHVVTKAHASELTDKSDKNDDKDWVPQNQRVEQKEKEQLREILSTSVRKNELPEKIKWKSMGFSQEANVEYTLNQSLQKQAQSLLKSYKPDYGAIFMMNAKTGEVLAMASYERGATETTNLNLRAAFPVASVFKVITATTAIETAGAKPDMKIFYNGGAYTLYKRNVMSDKVTRWTNVISLKDAFARSINTAFGRLSIEHLNPKDIASYADKFMFNQKILADFDVEPGIARVPSSKGYELAEVASGFNKINKMSPVQGAMIAGAVVNDGVMMTPYLVSHLSKDNGKEIYSAEPLVAQDVMSKASADKVRELMERTISNGTSRRTFRTLARDRKFSELDMGGKTGHLTGDNPKGQVDWFVGYAQFGSQKISVAAITVNKKFWTVKSGHLAQTMIRNYFKPIGRKTASR